MGGWGGDGEGKAEECDEGVEVHGGLPDEENGMLER